MKAPNQLDSISIENFKAIRKSGSIRLTPFTAIIGNNGSGKSSLIEALEFTQTVVQRGLPDALEAWRGFEHIWNKFDGPPRRAKKAHPMSFTLDGHIVFRGVPAKLKAGFAVSPDPYSDKAVLLDRGARISTRSDPEFDTWETASLPPGWTVDRPSWSTQPDIRLFLSGLQFLMLNPDLMGAPIQSSPLFARRIARDGRNISDYLYEFQNEHPEEFAGFVDSIRFVVPYLQQMDVQQSLDIVRTTFMSIVEQKQRIPGWLVSSGTLRVCAIMACLMHPEPPTLLVIEEIENGLDPRTLGMVTSAIQSAVESGKTQVIATTHSPTFLDGVPPEYILTVQRDLETGEPKFKRVNPEQLGKWLDDFSPGRLYTMGVLTR